MQMKLLQHLKCILLIPRLAFKQFLKSNFEKKSRIIPLYTEGDSKVGNFARRLRQFFSWSERPLCKHKAQVKEKNWLQSRRSKKPTFESRLV